MTNSRTGAGVVPMTEAARKLGTTVLSLLMQIRQGRLEGIEIEGEWQVTRESLVRFENQPRPERGRSHCRGNCRAGCRENGSDA